MEPRFRIEGHGAFRETEHGVFVTLMVRDAQKSQLYEAEARIERATGKVVGMSTLASAMDESDHDALFRFVLRNALEVITAAAAA